MLMSCVTVYNVTICLFGKKLLCPKLFTHPEKVYTLQSSGCDTACLDHSMSRHSQQSIERVYCLRVFKMYKAPVLRLSWSQFHGMSIRICLHIESSAAGKIVLICDFFHEKNHTIFSFSCEKIFKEQLDIEKSYDGILKKTLSLVILYWSKKQLTTTRGFYNMAHAWDIFFIFWTFCKRGLSCLEGCVK